MGTPNELTEMQDEIRRSYEGTGQFAILDDCMLEFTTSIGRKHLEKLQIVSLLGMLHFDDNQRQATKDACIIAGFDVVRIINDSIAASLAYGLDKIQRAITIMTFAFGAGALSVSIREREAYSK